MYKKIYNPVTKKLCDLSSSDGKAVLIKYLDMYLQFGGEDININNLNFSNIVDDKSNLDKLEKISNQIKQKIESLAKTDANEAELKKLKSKLECIDNLIIHGYPGDIENTGILNNWLANKICKDALST